MKYNKLYANVPSCFSWTLPLQQRSLHERGWNIESVIHGTLKDSVLLRVFGWAAVQTSLFVSCAAESHPAVPLRLRGVRFGASRPKTPRDAFSSSRRQTESHQKQILTQVSPSTWTHLHTDRFHVDQNTSLIILWFFCSGCSLKWRPCLWSKSTSWRRFYLSDPASLNWGRKYLHFPSKLYISC